MAMNYLEKKREEQQRTADSGGGLRGVSQQTQKQLQNYQQGYQAGQQVQQAQQNLQQVQAQKPQSYSSKYGAQLESILQQIQNPGEFKYDFNGDALFKAYADMYTQNAKQGALNAAGIAAGLTGGYGNTYAQSAANQAYQQNLSQLYDRGVDFMNAAYNRYAADRADRYDQMSALQNAENADYNRYRDTMTDYYADLDRAREDARYEDETGYNRYADMLNYWQNQAAAENADWQAGEEMDYRYNTLDEQARQADLDEAYRQAQLAEQIRGTNLDEAYRQATLAENQRQANMDEQYRRDTLGWQQSTDARDYEESVRQYNQNLAENQRQFDSSMAQSAEQFAANNQLDWANLEEKQRQYDSSLSEEQRQYNQKMAASWVADILANGQIPSNDLLVAAGLSMEDAQKLVAEVQGAGGPGGRKTDQEIVSEAALSMMPGYKGLGMEAGSDYEAMANTAKDMMGEYEKGSAEYDAAAKLASLYSNASKVKDTITANKGTNQSTTAGNATSTQSDIYNSILAKTTKKEDAGTQLKWDEKLKKYVQVK